MFSLMELMLLLCCGVIAMLFWQLRQISEAAGFHAQRLCQQRRLQLLNVARVKARLGKIPGHGLGWRTEYQVEFSTDGLNSLTAKMAFLGPRLNEATLPLYPEPEWQQAPANRGRIGMGSCSSSGCGSKSSCGSKRC
ncbi:DUF3301 domain-containing protein [Ferrimonas gelatinilytica]|uniref:DUF3301 domain-containing protein n=1 Tax=Ferrimonas gelatinilytica TaxID=1255257 RepID=A0ABP9S3Y4_9GAMM